MTKLFVYLLLFSFISIPVAMAEPRSACEKLKVCLLLDHDQTDAWSQMLRMGLEVAAQKHGIETKIVISQSHVANERSQVEAFRAAAEEGGLVLVASDSLHEILRDNAGNYRQTMFGCIDTGIRAPNIMSVSFADEGPAFLAGAAAARLTKTCSLPGINKELVLGWLSGEDSHSLRSMLNSFHEGAQIEEPGIRVIHAVAGSFTDRDRAKAQALRLMDAGADVLVLAAGPANPGALEAVKERGAYIIGMDADQRALLPGRVLASISKRADLAVQNIVAAAATGAFKGKQVVTWSMEDGGTELLGIDAFVRSSGARSMQGMEERLAELRQEILKGHIQLRSLRARTLCDCQ